MSLLRMNVGMANYGPHGGLRTAFAYAGSSKQPERPRGPQITKIKTAADPFAREPLCFSTNLC